jgi:sialate O-acetylesterase
MLLRDMKNIAIVHLMVNSPLEPSRNSRADFRSGIWRSIFAFCLFTLSISVPPASGDPTLPHLFSDHMVLQRDAPIHVWGKAEPSEKLSVDFVGHSAQAIADADGNWGLFLPSMPAGGPFALQVTGKKMLVFRDVMIGEVWLASGQSNMAFELKGAEGSAQEIANAANPQLRFFAVPKKISLKLETDILPAYWEVCSPDSAKRFSAVAYFFGRQLQEDLGVPVGIILSVWPGTSGEEWTDPDSLRREPELRPIAQRWEAAAADVRSFAAEPAKVSVELDDFELLPAAGATNGTKLLSNFDDGLSRTTFGGSWSYDWKEAEATTFELAAPGRGGAGFAALVHGQLDGASTSMLHATFHLDGSPENLSTFAGIRFWIRGNASVQFQAIQPTISDWDNYSAEIIRATPEWQPVTIWFKDLKQAGWGVVQPFTPNTLTGLLLNIMAPAGDPDRPPSGLFNGMIAPLNKYRIRGAIWYQGESNTWRAEQYRTLLPSLIEGWRKSFSEPDFQFLIVQLPNLGSSPELGNSIWAELREAQLLTAKHVPNAGLAVTIDLGDPNNLHPPRKREIAERLELWALGTTYGRKAVYSGPLYNSMKVVGDKAHIRFLYIGDGLAARGESLKGFSIAGADRKFRWANAQIEGEEVVVSNPDVPSPVAVRYAWANSPECNLYNKNRLPASPFRTDDWPVESTGKR